MKELENSAKEQLELEAELKDSLGIQAVGLLDGFMGVLPKDEYYKLSEKKCWDTLQPSPAGDDLNSLTYASNGKEFLDPMGNAVKIDVVINKKNVKQFKQNLILSADEMDKSLDEHITSDDELNNTAKEVIKSISSKPARRLESGLGNDYICYKNILGYGIKSFAPTLDISISDNKLQNNIKKYQKDFPIHQLTIEGEKQLEMISDYYSEKEKKGGILSPKNENEYRQKLYDQTIIMSELYQKSMSFVEKKANVERLKQDKVLQNDPFHLHPMTERGTRPLNSGLIAMKTGLENGWELDDINMLAAFHQLYFTCKNVTLNNSGITFDGFVKYDAPVYDVNPNSKKAKDNEEFIKQLENHWKKIEQTKLASPKDRKDLLDGMETIVKQGVDKGLLNDTKKSGVYKYFNQTAQNRAVREYRIAKKKERAFCKPEENIKVENRGHLTLISVDLNAQRTDLRFGDENAEHKNLRLALESLMEFNKKKMPELKDGSDKIKEYAAEYLAKLDAVDLYSKIYVEKKQGAKSSGGKKRLKGAMDAEEYVVSEKKKLIEKMKEAGVKFENDGTTLNSFRENMALQKSSGIAAKMALMKAIPQKAEEQAVLKDMAADILVGSIIHGFGNGNKTAAKMGSDVLKENIMKDKEFDKLFKSYMKDKTMTPSKLSQELMGGATLNKLHAVGENIKKTQKKMDEVAKMKEKSKQKSAANSKKQNIVKK